jgi:hypothetical protein
LQRIAAGDERCLFILNERDEDISTVLEDDSLASLYPPCQMDDRWRLETGKAGFAEQFVIHVRTLSEALGHEEALKALEPFMRAAAEKVLPLVREMLPSITKDDPGEAIELLNASLGQLGPGTSVNGGTVSKEVVQCPFQGSPSITCRAFESFADSLCKLLDRRASFSYRDMMSEGCAFCTWAIDSQPSAVQKKIVSEAKEGEGAPGSKEDPVHILNVRLAKGEISLQEYRELMEIIKGGGY